MWIAECVAQDQKSRITDGERKLQLGPHGAHECYFRPL